MKNRSVMKLIACLTGSLLFLNAISAQSVLAEGAGNQDTSGKEILMVIPDVSKMSAKERAEFEWEYGEEMLHVVRKDVLGEVWGIVKECVYNPDGSVKEYMEYTNDISGKMTGYKCYEGDVLEFEEQYTFDTDGNRIGSVSTYYKEGKVDYIYEHSYNPNGDILSDTNTYYNEDGSIRRVDRGEYTYDSNGNKTKYVFYYNGAVLLTYAYLYDGAKTIRVEQYDKDGALQDVTEYLYDGENCIQENNYSYNSGISRLYGYTRYAYDAYGNEIELAHYKVSEDGTESFSGRRVCTYVQAGGRFYLESMFYYDSDNDITRGVTNEHDADGINQRVTIYVSGGKVGYSTAQGVPAFPSGASVGAQARKRDNTYDKDNNLIYYKEMTYQMYELDEEVMGDTESTESVENIERTENTKVASVNGLIYSPDGNWHYFVKGSANTDYTGLVHDANVGWWYVKNGVIDFGMCGLVANDYGWWYVNGGAIDFDYTGLAYDANAGWWYVENGAINFGYSGSCTYNGATYQVVNGAVL